MSRLARSIAGLLYRSGLARRGAGRAELERQRRTGWRRPLDEALLRRLERLSLTPTGPARGGLGGEHRSRARAASTDFADYRPYQPGDDFRQIDWNAYGRLDQLYVKLTEARERSTVQVLLDCSASMDYGEPNKLDYARQLTAAIGYAALARFDRVELHPIGGRGSAPRPLRSKARFGELLGALDAVRAEGALDLQAALAGFRPSRPAGQAVLISDMLHPAGYQPGLGKLAMAGLEPTVIQVLSPGELEPAAEGDVELEDLESGERVEVGLSPSAVESYRRRLAEWCGGVERACAESGFRYVRVSTAQPLAETALVTLRRVGLLR